MNIQGLPAKASATKFYFAVRSSSLIYKELRGVNVARAHCLDRDLWDFKDGEDRICLNRDIYLDLQEIC